jgi:hypothetical protein
VFLMLFVSVAPVTAKERLQSDNRVVLAIPGCAKREEFEAMIDLAQRRDTVGFAEVHGEPQLPGAAGGNIRYLRGPGLLRSGHVRSPTGRHKLPLDTKRRGAEARAIRPVNGVLTSNEGPSAANEGQAHMIRAR